MLKGYDLIGYAVNAMGGDKLVNLMTILEEISDNDLSDLTRRAISLINPYNQYSFLEESILNIKDCESKIKDLLKSYKIDVPIKYGWRHVSYHNGKQRDIDEHEWYNERHVCCSEMHKDVRQTIQAAMDCLVDIPITINQSDGARICIEAGSFKDIYELYEM